MITVVVYINDRPVITRSARNIGNVPLKFARPICIYSVDDGRKIQHAPEDGAALLAQKLLEGVESI